MDLYFHGRIYSGFGDSSLDLVCRFYIDDYDNLWPSKTGLHLEIYRRFEEAGIEISRDEAHKVFSVGNSQHWGPARRCCLCEAKQQLEKRESLF